MRNGTRGVRAAKLKARPRKPKKPIKKSILQLTENDYHFIRANPHNMSQRELGEMFGQHLDKILKIIHGHVPAHLRETLARSRFLDSQADT